MLVVRALERGLRKNHRSIIEGELEEVRVAVASRERAVGAPDLDGEGLRDGVVRLHVVRQVRAVEHAGLERRGFVLSHGVAFYVGDVSRQRDVEPAVRGVQRVGRECDGVGRFVVLDEAGDTTRGHDECRICDGRGVQGFRELDLDSLDEPDVRGAIGWRHGTHRRVA